ncbi:MAG TPA: protein YgfX [Cellvibrionaceae bacterium]
MSELTPRPQTPSRHNTPPSRLHDDAEVFIECTITPSPTLFWVYCLVLGAALAALLLACYPLFRSVSPSLWLWPLLFGSTTIALGGWHLWHHWRASCWRLRLDRQGWWLASISGVWQPVEMHSRALLWPQLMVLGYAQAPGTSWQWLVLMPDSCAEDEWRRLRVWLVMTFRANRAY